MAIPTIKQDSGIAPPTRWYSGFKETGHPVFKSSSALSRGILKQTDVPLTSMEIL